VYKVTVETYSGGSNSIKCVRTMQRLRY